MRSAHTSCRHWLEWAHDYGFGRHTIGVALFAGAATIVIAVISAIATYIDNYYTESVGQYVANDLRIRIYEHLHRLSLAFYDRTQTGTLLSTITNDVATVQSFASASTLGILVDLMTIVGMLGLMFWLNWDFTLIAVAVTPFLLLVRDALQESGQGGPARGAQAAERRRRRRRSRGSARSASSRRSAGRISRQGG